MTENNTHEITFKVSPDAFQRINANADTYGLDVPNYMRFLTSPKVSECLNNEQFGTEHTAQVDEENTQELKTEEAEQKQDLSHLGFPIYWTQRQQYWIIAYLIPFAALFVYFDVSFFDMVSMGLAALAPIMMYFMFEEQRQRMKKLQSEQQETDENSTD